MIPADSLLECVVNVSEGRDEEKLARLSSLCGSQLLDLHRDPAHHRSVFSLGGPGTAVEQAARSLTAGAVELLDLDPHVGVHPRFGVVDVVPFVPLHNELGPVDPGAPVDGLAPAVAARDRFARWAAGELGLPCFLYGPLADGSERTLPEVRRGAFLTLVPDLGPHHAHHRAGAIAVGARRVLVAYNLWITGDVGAARHVARAVRSSTVRALGLDVETGVQVSCNLLEPAVVGPAEIYDQVTDALQVFGARIERAELVGLVPSRVVEAVPPRRWREIDVGPDVTIEARLPEGSLRRR